MAILQGFFAAILLCAAASTAGAQQASGVYATYDVLYDGSGNLDSVAAYCSTYDDNMSASWLRQYEWTAFDGPASPGAPAFCGQCLQVTNPATGASTTVRIVDQCANGGLDLSPAAFNTLDTNKDGYASGHLTVNYEFVSC